MKVNVEQFFAILLYISVGCLLIFLLFNLYLIIRNGFYVNVNCWFCNTWSKVLYANRNSFDCPSCSQYNGFDKDGGYNKEIAAQHSIETYKPSLQSNLSNGLCKFCNNNQQLKVIQLAKFVPLYEDNYDVEIEHFQKQLEKAYKLCKKCDAVLKQKLKNENAWIFGNRLKHLKNKTTSLLNMTADKQHDQHLLLKIIHHALLLMSVSIFVCSFSAEVKCLEKFVPDTFMPYVVLAKDVYSIFVCSFSAEVKCLEKFVPDTFMPYVVLAKDVYKNVLNAANNIPALENPIYSRIFSIKALAVVGFLLQFVCLWDKHSKILKMNRLISWTIVLLTSWIPFTISSFYINNLQMFCSGVQIYFSLTTSVQNCQSPRKQNKPPGKSNERDDSDVEEEDAELEKESNSSRASNSTINSMKQKHSCCHSSPSNASVFDNTAIFYNNFSKPNHQSYRENVDLNKSLEDLHLDLNFRAKSCSPPIFPTNPVNLAERPILSPSKLKNITQNSWVAGGFWRNEDGSVVPLSEFPHMSRSSSESSGFVSQNNEHQENQFYSVPNSLSEFDRSSFRSEPLYHFKPISPPALFSNNYPKAVSPRMFAQTSSPKPSVCTGPLYYKNENTFYPVLNADMLIFSQNCSHPQSFYNGERLSTSGKSNLNGFLKPMSSPTSTTNLFKPYVSPNFQPYMN